MGKFIITSDWHVKLWTDKETTSDNIPLRLHEIFSSITQLCEYARMNNIDHIIVAGDINDLKNVVHVKAFVRLKKILDLYSDINFTFTHGNHDATARIDTDSAIELLANNEHIRAHVIGPLIEDNIAYLPYSKSMADEIRDLDESIEILIGHFGVNEAQLSNGHSIKTAIRATDLSRFKLVLLGHYHKPQNFENIWYMGSLIQMRRDEANEEKRFLVVDSETFKVESVPITGYRKYHQFIIDDANTADAMISEAQTLKDAGDFVYIRKLIKEIIEVPHDMTIIDEYEPEFEVRGITSAMSLTAQMKKYMEIENIPPEEQEQYLAIGLKGINAE